VIPPLLVISGWMLIALPGRLGPTSKLRSDEWARVSAAALLTGAVALESGLLLMALPALLGVVGDAHAADFCHGILAPFPIAGTAVGLLAAVVALVVGLRFAAALRDARSQAHTLSVEPWLGRHEARGDYDLVVLPTDRLLAMSIPGPHAQVVITQGLVDCLPPDEVEAVIAHEASHQHNHHWRYSTLASAVERGFAPSRTARRSAETLRTAIETWADDCATSGSNTSRSALRRAIQRVAQLGRVATGHWSFAERVRIRVARLERPTHAAALSTRVAALLPVAALVGISIALLGGSMFGVHHAAALDTNC